MTEIPPHSEISARGRILGNDRGHHIMRKPHPSEIEDARRIANAIGYSVHFLKGPHERFNETAQTLEQAREIAKRLNEQHGQHGRRAIIYARLADGGSVPLKGWDDKA
jgi:hypothetical protein